MIRKSLITIAALAAVIAVVVWFAAPKDHDHSEHSRGDSGVKVPMLSQVAEQGKSLFDVNCVVCHGKNATGTQNGPPLVHKIYEPNHHSDLSFQRAVKFGVRAHHWPFGNMPPVLNVTEAEVSRIISYVRELQRANGIR